MWGSQQKKFGQKICIFVEVMAICRILTNFRGQNGPLGLSQPLVDLHPLNFGFFNRPIGQSIPPSFIKKLDFDPPDLPGSLVQRVLSFSRQFIRLVGAVDAVGAAAPTGFQKV